MNNTYTVPYVKKREVSLIVIGFVGTEPEALRSTLEGFNFRVDTHRVGSKAELIKILSGEIPTSNQLILSCHGSADGIIVDGELPLNADEVLRLCNLKDKQIISMGCQTGSKTLANSILGVGASTYIAPKEDIDGNTCLLFVYHLFYYLVNGDDLLTAYNKSYMFDQESKLFAFFDTKDIL